jgi:hypothetical protein
VNKSTHPEIPGDEPARFDKGFMKNMKSLSFAKGRTGSIFDC